MISRVLAGLLVAGCVTAAAGGAYVAIRQNAASGPASHPAAVQSSPGQPVKTPEAVAETEAVVALPAEATPPSVTLPSATPTATTAPAKADQPARRTVPEPIGSESPRATASARSSGPRDLPAPRRAARAAQPPSAPPAQASAAPAVTAERAGTETPGATPAVEAAPEATRAPEPPAAPAEPRFEEVVLPASSVIGLQVTTPLSSERTRPEDRVDARVTRDVTSAGRVAIPEGSRVIGSVTLVERGGKMKERARLGVRFHTLVLADGSEVPLRTEPIYREGESPTGESARKIGGAASGGAILGAIMGGGKGAVIGGATGAAGGSAAVMAGDRNAATLPGGTVVTVRLLAPATIEVPKREQ
jgi:hypothetical protein